MMKWAAIVMLSGALAGCGGSKAPEPGNTATAAAPDARDPVEDKINALDDVGKKVTFYRAILDADFKCKKVVTIKPKPRDAGKPVWLITCDDKGEYVVTLQAGGVFDVSGVKQPDRLVFPKATATPDALK